MLFIMLQPTGFGSPQIQPKLAQCLDFIESRAVWGQWGDRRFARLAHASLLTVAIFAISAFCWLSPAQAEPTLPNETPLLFSPSLVFPCVSPLGSIHTYQEQPGQTTFRSKQSLRDRRDRSWQVILFKRYQANDFQGLYLRLVGFPKMVAVDREKPITIATGASTQWQASAELDPQTSELPEYAAQYNVAEAISALAGDIPLQINIPLGDGSIAQLVVPPFAVSEWRNLNARSPL